MAARKEHSRLATALLTGAGLALLLGILSAAGALEPLELKTYDLRMRWTTPPLDAPRKPVHPDILFINVTDESIEWMKEKKKKGWPWDRREFARLIKGCSDEPFEAAVVLFDFFTLQDLDPYQGEPELIQALKGPTPVYVAVPFRKEPVKQADARPDLESLLQKFSFEVVNDGSVRVEEKDRKSVVLPLEGIAEAVAGVCDVETVEGTDGITRQYQLFSKFRGRHYPSFVLAALMVREKTRKVEVRNRTLHVGRSAVPVEGNGAILLRYYRSDGGDFEVHSAPDVISAVEGKATKFDVSLAQGKVVFIGTDASALFDLKVTPVSEVMPGVEIHGVALANVLKGEMMRSAPGGLSTVFLVLFAFAACGVTRFTGPAHGALASVALFGLYALLNLVLFRARWVADLVAPSAAVVLGYAATSGINYLYEGRQRQRVKREFQRYLAPKVVDKILKNPDALSMEGERKMLSIFFMDFAGFTSMSEKLDPADLVKLISEYHNEAAEEIFRTEGTLDKYIGDAIMAFWNDPIPQDDHALRACLSAVAAQQRLRALVRQMKDRGLPELQARIGINTGIATVGNMGARGQVNYTLIGDEVNLASRLEGVNKEFGTEIIVSEATYLPAKEKLEVRELALIKVKGKKLPVRIYELLGMRGEVAAERIATVRRFDEALAEFRARKFQRAWEMFLSLSQAHDPASEVYTALCERYLHQPPAPGWDGSYQMESK